MVLQSILKLFVGDKHGRERKRLWPIVEEINALAAELEALSDDELKAKTEEFRRRLGEGETLDDLLPEAYAVVKEACRRNLGRTWKVTDQDFTWDMVPFDVQLFGGIVLHEGKIAEMATGEGKTLVAVLPLYLNSLEGRGVHLVTVNDYLARRDSEWVGEILRWLGLTVGCIQNQMSSEHRREAYACDVTYGTNNEFGFDYLRDNMAVAREQRVQRGHNFAIIDEVDSVLIDEARTPLIISGPTHHDTSSKFGELKPLVERLVREQTRIVNQLVSEAEKALEEGGEEGLDYEAGIKLFQARRGMPKHNRLMKVLNESGVKKLVQKVEADFMREKRAHELDEALLFAMDEKGHDAHLTDLGREKIAPNQPDLFVVPDLSQLMHEIDVDPELPELEKSAKRLEAEREYAEKSETIHNISQLIKAYALYEKDVEYVVQDGKVLIVDQFTGRLMPGRRYSEGMHQAIEAKEGVQIEGETQTLATITIQNYYRMYDKLAGMTGTAETEEGEFWQIYKMDVVVIPTNREIRRQEYDDMVYKTRREKYNAIIDEIEREHGRGRPVLVGTVSVEVSETLSRLLKRRNLPHNVLNAKHHQREAEIVARAGQPGAITIATNMAGRGTDIKLGPGVVPRAWPEVAEDELPGVPREGLEAVIEEDMPWGLHIVGTERHESRRIDRQLRGRSGRQGDPGSSRFFLSLEDDLMRLFSSDRIASVMDRLGAEEGEVITHPLVTRSIERAQKKVELNNFEIRKRLLEYDDVMNKQREVIYAMRLRALEGDKEEVFAEAKEIIRDAAEEKIAQFMAPDSYAHDWDLTGLREDLMRTYLLPFDWLDQLAREGEAGSGDTELPTTWDGIADRVISELEDAFDRRVEEWEPERAQMVVRQVLLRVIDEKWRDHLYELDQLKGGIQYRAWGQKDPLLEYKTEAFQMFVEMMDDLRSSASQLLFRVQIVDPRAMSAEDRRRRERVQRQQVAMHRVAPAMAGALSGGTSTPTSGLPSAPDRQTAPEASRTGAIADSDTFVREGEKVGRNDPCPCGSGKKYKKCHGA